MVDMQFCWNLAFAILVAMISISLSVTCSAVRPRSFASRSTAFPPHNLFPLAPASKSHHFTVNVITIAVVATIIAVIVDLYTGLPAYLSAQHRLHSRYRCHLVESISSHDQYYCRAQHSRAQDNTAEQSRAEQSRAFRQGLA